MLTPAQRQQFLQAERGLDALTVRRLRALLSQMDEPGSDAFIRDILAALPVLVAELADVSAEIGASSYDLSREQSDARGRFSAILAPPPTAEWVQGVARGALFQRTEEFPERVPPNVIVQRLEAASPRVVRYGGRETVAVSSERDPARPRYQRMVRAGGCDFCKMLAGRGAVYRSQDSAGASIHFHDHCGCRIEVVFTGEEVARSVPAEPPVDLDAAFA